MKDKDRTRIAFIDETGDEQLNLAQGSVSDYYILSAILIDAGRYQETSNKFEDIGKKHFKANEIKSTLRSLKNNPQKREMLLRDISEVDFSLYLYVVNKGSLGESRGLQYPKNFIKYFHHQFYSRIIDDYDIVHIVVDEIKGHKFHEEFSLYIKKKFDIEGPRLFYPITFDFVNSKENIFVQIADVLAGTVALSFEGKTCQEHHEKYKSILAPHIVDFMIFPEIFSPYVIKEPQTRLSVFDDQIEKRAMYNSYEFIKENINSEDEKVQPKVFCLQKLREAYFEKGKQYWIPTQVLLNTFEGKWGINTDQVLRNLIGQLRDAGNLIVSRHSGGYKLATSKADYCEFINVMNTQISPMIARIETARNNVLRATDKKVDILDEPQYENLKSIVGLNCKWTINESESE